MVGVGMALRRKGARRRSRRVKSQDDGGPFSMSHLPTYPYNPSSVCWLDAFLALATRPLVAPRSAARCGRGYYDIIIGGPKLEHMPPLATLASTSRNGQLREMQPHQLPESL